MIFETDAQRCLFWNMEYTGTDRLFWRKLAFLFLVNFFFLSVKLTYVPLEKYINIWKASARSTFSLNASIFN